jgi:2-polyprenyl-3-methyl-5-hydroxy-6-metoxy-1,4-benzoquinol methylase
MKFVSPRPDAREIARYYESPDYVSHDAAKKSAFNFLYRQLRKYSIRKKYLLVNRYSGGKKILDIGCGTGEFIFYCRQKGYDTAGIEPGEKPRTFARTQFDLPVEDEDGLQKITGPEFDVITLWHVLEHVHALTERMNKIVQILKPGGTLVVAVPNCDSWDAKYYGKFWAAYDLPRHLYHFSQEPMKILAATHSLEIEKIIPMKLDSFYISLLSEKYSKGKQNYFRSVINGFRSNKFARNNHTNYSSLIFVMKKAKNGK